jgi:hypothetical protein
MNNWVPARRRRPVVSPGSHPEPAREAAKSQLGPRRHPGSPGPCLLRCVYNGPSLSSRLVGVPDPRASARKGRYRWAKSFFEPRRLKSMTRLARTLLAISYQAAPYHSVPPGRSRDTLTSWVLAPIGWGGTTHLHGRFRSGVERHRQVLSGDQASPVGSDGLGSTPTHGSKSVNHGKLLLVAATGPCDGGGHSATALRRTARRIA